MFASTKCSNGQQHLIYVANRHFDCLIDRVNIQFSLLYGQIGRATLQFSDGQIYGEHLRIGLSFEGQIDGVNLWFSVYRQIDRVNLRSLAEILPMSSFDGQIDQTNLYFSGRCLRQT